MTEVGGKQVLKDKQQQHEAFDQIYEICNEMMDIQVRRLEAFDQIYEIWNDVMDTQVRRLEVFDQIYEICNDMTFK